MAEKLDQEAGRQKKKVHIHLAVDTGMSRIGFADNEESVEEIRKIAGLENVRIEGMFTHFARADEKDKAPATAQLRRYLKFSELLENAGVRIPLRHCSNSAGIIRMPEANLNIVRAGITIYGIYPSSQVERDIVKLTPAMELISHLTFVKDIPAGTAVSYARNICGGKACPGSNCPGRVCGRISQKLIRQRMGADPWKTSPDSWENLYGSVYGGCDGHSRSAAGR